MSQAFKLKADASFPRPIRLRKLADGKEFWVTEGRSYNAEDTISGEDMLPRDLRRALDAELDHLLEPISEDEVPEKEPVTPEHEAERTVLIGDGQAVEGGPESLAPPEPLPVKEEVKPAQPPAPRPRPGSGDSAREVQV